MNRFHKIDQSFPDTDSQEKNKVFEDLKRILKFIDDSVNMPCKEQAEVVTALHIFYQKNIKVSKLKRLHSSS